MGNYQDTGQQLPFSAPLREAVTATQIGEVNILFQLGNPQSFFVDPGWNHTSPMESHIWVLYTRPVVSWDIRGSRVEGATLEISLGSRLSAPDVIDFQNWRAFTLYGEGMANLCSGLELPGKYARFRIINAAAPAAGDNAVTGIITVRSL